jgi:hypothetical protein
MGVFDPPASGSAPTSSASPVASPLDPNARYNDDQRTASEQGNLWHNFTGFFSNAFQDLKDIGGGLADVIGMGAHDVNMWSRDVMNLIPGVNYDTSEGYASDDMFDAMFGLGDFKEGGSVLLNDYQARYGQTFSNPTSTLEATFQHPLSFISDALSLATAGGFTAAKGAAVAEKLGVASADDAGRAGQLIRAIQGSAENVWNPISGRVEALDILPNPVRRALSQSPIVNATIKKGTYFQKRAEQYAKLAESSGIRGIRRLHTREQYRNLAEQAMQIADDTAASGAKYAFRPGYAASKSKKFVDALVGATHSRETAMTGELLKSWDDHVGRYVNGDSPLDEEVVVENMTGMDSSLTHDDIVGINGDRRDETFSTPVGPESFDENVSWGRAADDTLVREPNSDVPTLATATPAPRAAAETAPVPDDLAEAQAAFDEATRIADEQLSRNGRVSNKRVDEVNAAQDRLDAVVKREGLQGRSDSDIRAEAAIRARRAATASPTSGGTAHAPGYSVDDTGGGGVADAFMMNGPDGVYTSVQKTGTGNEYSMKAAQVPIDVRGTGRGKALYRETAAEVKRRGGQLVSDRSLTPEAEHVWQSFVRSGEAGQRPDGSYEWLDNPLVAGRETDEDLIGRIRAQAQRDTVELTPKLRKAVGNLGKVIFGKAKSRKGILRKSDLVGGIENVDDASRFRIVVDDVTKPGTAEEIMRKVEGATGGKVRKLENTLSKPGEDGSRMLRAVVEMPDGHPVEFQIMSHGAAKVMDATENIRSIVSAMGGLGRRGLLVGDDAMTFQKALLLQKHLWEGVTDDMRHKLGGPQAAKMRRELNDFRVDVFGKSTDRLLGRGLSVDSAFDNAYMTLRYKHGARTDPKQAGLVGGPSPLMLDKTMAEAGEMAPIYYPMMKESDIPKRGNFMLKGGASSTKDQNLLRNSGKLIEENSFSKDSRKVWSIRAAQAARVQERMDMLFDTVSTYGRPLRAGDELRPGEEAFAPVLAQRALNQQAALLDSLMDDPSGRSIEQLLEKMTGDNLAQAQEFAKSGGDIEMFAVPKVVADRLRHHTSWIPKNSALQTFGAVNGVWKSMVLAGRPAWMVNNLLTNTMLLKLQGGRLSDVVKQLDRSYLKKMREAIGPEALARIEGGMYSGDEIGSATRFTTDDALGRAASTVQQRVGGSRVGRGASRGVSRIQALNSGLEDAFRRASYLTAAERQVIRRQSHGLQASFFRSTDRIEKAFQAGLDEKSFGAAVDEVNKYMNDYAAASPAARNIVRPYISPFFSFYRHAAKILIDMPFDHPAKSRLFALVEEADQERMRVQGGAAELPGWMKGSSMFLGKTAAGDYRFMNEGGFNPFNAVLANPFQSFNPAWKILVEQQTGESTFNGRPFTDPSVATSFGSSQQYRLENGKMEPVERVTPGILEHLMQQIPQYELLKDVLAGGSTYDTTTLLDVLRGEGPVLDSETGEPANPRDLVQLVGKLLGYGETDFDAEDYATRLADGRKAAMEAWLARQQLAPTTDAPSSGGGVFDP